MKSEFRFPRNVALLLAVVAIIAAAGAVSAENGGLPHDNLPAQAVQNLPPTKRAFLENIEATEVAVQTAIPAAPKNPNRTHPTPVPRPTFSTRIVDATDRPVPLPSQFYKIENAWVGNIAGNDIVAYAGLKQGTDDLPRGVLFVSSTPRTSSGQPSGLEYLAPVQVGSIHLVSSNGSRLTLAETNGIQQFVFNLVTRTWVSP